MVHRPDRIVDIIDILRKNKLEPKEIKFIFATAQTTSKCPRLCGHLDVKLRGYRPEPH